MFGYVTVCRPEIKFKDFDTYRSYYCGVCRALRSRAGLNGQGTLSFDMTFLEIFLSALYEPETVRQKKFCLLHPAAKQTAASNRFTAYAADMNLLLSYYDLQDDWQDDKKLTALLRSKGMRGKVRAVKEAWPRQAEAVENYVRQLSACEKEKRQDLDEAAGLTGHMLEEIFVYEQDAWEPYVRKIGFYLGKFIYLMDAYEDLEKDIRRNAYNPWASFGETRLAVHAKAQEVLNMMMGECSLAFERLPVIRHEDILRNILYAGVWNRFEELHRKDLAAREKAEKEAKGV